MHNTSLMHAAGFFFEYVKKGDRVLDVGSKTDEVSLISYRTILKRLGIEAQYDGIDMEAGSNVDFVVKDPYNWTEIEDDTYDIVICGQVLEHSEFFWLLFEEMVRVLKPNGYLCVIAPIKCKVHKFPVDCWRFLPDGMRALAKYTNIELVKTGCHMPCYDWGIDRGGKKNPNDTVGVFRKSVLDDITCVMLYYGRRELAEEAIESFLRQTYPHKKLVIVNTHPDPVWFEEDYPDIEVHNVKPDPFNNLNEKYNYALAQVKTKWWCPWDSDDIWLPWHLENLAADIKHTENKGTPRKIGLAKSYFMLGEKKTINLGWNMWATSIWETFDKDGNVHAQCDPDRTTNCDRQILYLDWDRHWLDRGGPKKPISYIYRWDLNKGHNRSAVLGEAGKDRGRKLREDMSKRRTTEPLKPQWRSDYVKLVEGEHETFAGV